MRMRGIEVVKKDLSLLLQVVIVLGIAGLLLWFLMSFLQNAMTWDGTRSCRNRLSELARGFKSQDEFSGQLPYSGQKSRDGKPPCSWRVSTLSDFGYHVDEPWNSPHNSSLPIERWPSLHYHCDKDPGPKENTSYVVVTGATTAFPPDGTTSILKDFQDVAPNTILMVEMHNSGIHWMEPRDLDIEEAIKGINLKDRPSISSRHTYFDGKKRNGAFAAFADGSVRWISSSIDSKTLRSLIEIKNPDKPKAMYSGF